LLRFPTKPLPVGDSFEVSVQYRVTEAIYSQYRDVMGSWAAKAVVYVNGAPIAQRVFEQIQEF
jgi:hypothetical protein